MGNIFKTLGIDDFFRDNVPVIGGGVGNFLAGLGGKQVQDKFLSNVTTGPNPARVSNEDFQHNQNLLDSGNPREAARQNQFDTMTNPTKIATQNAFRAGTADTEIETQGKFLKGLAAPQAEAYNSYQNSTYQGDIDRNIQRVQQTSEALGMSPWELNGGSAATPMPSPTMPSNQATPRRPESENSGRFLSDLVPLITAQMANKTQLETARMNNATALKQTEMQTGNQMDMAVYGQTGPESVSRQTLQAAQTGLAIANQNLVTTQAGAAENKMWLDTVETLARYAGKTTIDIPGIKSETYNNFPQLTRLYADLSAGEKGRQGSVAAYVKGLDQGAFTQLEKEMVRLSSMILSLARGTMGAASQAGGFLKGITDQVAKVMK